MRPHLERLEFDLPLAVNDSRGAPVVRNQVDGGEGARSRGELPESLRTVVALSESEKNKGPVPRPSPCGCCSVSALRQAGFTF